MWCPSFHLTASSDQSIRDIEQSLFIKCVTEFMEKPKFNLLVNFAYMFVLCICENHYIQKIIRIGIKIYVIENKLQPSENDPQSQFSVKNSLK